MLSLLWARFSGYIIAIGAALAALGGIYLKGRSAGKQAEQAAETEKALEQAKKGSEIDSSVRGLSDAELDKRLHMADRDKRN